MKRIFGISIFWLIPITAMAIDDDVCRMESFDQHGGLLFENLLPSTPSSDFEVVDNLQRDEVLHLTTGLIWQRCFLGQIWSEVAGTCEGSPVQYTPQDALVEAEQHQDAGWRIPNANELRTLVERCKYQPAVNTKVFPSPVANGYVLSSTVYPSSSWPGYYWVRVNFNTGTEDGDGRLGGFVRLVRDGTS